MIVHARTMHCRYSTVLPAVESFFSKRTRKRIRRGIFRSMADLQAAINRYLKGHNLRFESGVETLVRWDLSQQRFEALRGWLARGAGARRSPISPRTSPKPSSTVVNHPI
jgi:hypothetical protein